MIEFDGWIPFADYCEKYNEQPDTVRARVSLKVWERGVHYSTPTGNTAYVHEATARQWLVDKGKLK